MHIRFALRRSQVHLGQAISWQRDPLHKVEPRNGLGVTSCWRQFVPRRQASCTALGPASEVQRSPFTVINCYSGPQGSWGQEWYLLPYPFAPSTASSTCNLPRKYWLRQIKHHERVTPLGRLFSACDDAWHMLAQLCPTHCDPMNYSPPSSSVHGILQARILEWVAVPFSRGSSWPRNRTWVSCIEGRFFNNWAIREAP